MNNNKIKKAKISDNATFIYNGKKLDVVSDTDLQADNGYVRLTVTMAEVHTIPYNKDYETFIVDKCYADSSAFYILNMIKVHLI